MLFRGKSPSLRLEREIEKKTEEGVGSLPPTTPREYGTLLDIILLPLETKGRIKIVELLFSETKQNKSNQLVWTVGEGTEA